MSSVEAAAAAGRRMEEEGADILDVGGESTRPGSSPVSEEDEIRRVMPVLEELAKRVRIPLSIDTDKAGVAERALDVGASILNDIFALRSEGMAAVARRYELVVLMHMLGESSRTMQDDPVYRDVVEDLIHFFRERCRAFASGGGDVGRVWIDPGIGFGKTVEHNLEIMARLEELQTFGRPILIGASRKSFIGEVLGSEASPRPPEDRLSGSLAAAIRAAEAGAVCVRVHDVASTREGLKIWSRMRRSV